MLTVSGLRKCLPGGRELFHHLNFTLSGGECIAIMGESGAGKSTLLNIIAGLDSFDAGSIALDDRLLEGLSDTQLTALRRQHFGFVFQAFHILPHLSLLQNVELTLLLNQVPRALARERATAVLAEVGLGLRVDDFPRQLSGGELQRVAIARALVHRPAVLLADEPTGNLDPDNAARVLVLMSDLMRKNGTATLLVTHSEATAAIADRRLRLTLEGLEPF